MRTSRRLVLFAGVAGCLVALAGCRQDMHDAPRYDPYEASTQFDNGGSARPVVAGTVARGHLDENTHLFQGKVDGQPATAFPFPITRADLDRGQERFDVFCSPCHGRTGEGNGMVVQRGFRQAATYHIDRLRDAPVGYLFDVVTNGFGVMPDYKMQIPADDRWRIIAYVRALQLSHHATTADVPAGELPKLTSSGGPGGATAAAPPAKHGGQ